MARPPIDPARAIRDIPSHSEAVPPEAETPRTHYERSASDLWNLVRYAKLHFPAVKPPKPSAATGHLGRLHAMVLVSLIETFERFLKESAAACIDLIGDHVLDDRFKDFRVPGSVLAVHFRSDTLGRALCEASTWLDTDEVNGRFRTLLADPFEAGTFQLFPKQPAAERERYDTLALIWQLRHTVVHNVGVVTQSDAFKFRLMVRSDVPAPRLLVPTWHDLRYAKKFLDATAADCNGRVGRRVAEVLTALHAGNPALFDPKAMADRASGVFGMVLRVAGRDGAVAPP